MNRDNRLSNRVLYDAGGPLLFIFWFHALIGNIFIGLAEFYFVKKVFKVKLNRIGLFLIVAGNYISLIAGFLLSFFFNFPNRDDTFLIMLGPLLITLIVSIILEFPFFVFAIKKVEPDIQFAKMVSITASAQVFSYILMLTYYFVTRSPIID